MAAPLLPAIDPWRTARLPLAVILLWLVAVMACATSGAFAALWPPLIGGLVALTILLPTLWYALSPPLQALATTIGHRRIMLMHSWRIPAALLFFWYGFQGLLPPAFWILAGTGDLIAGSYALYLATKPESLARYRAFHRFGFADFVVAVGTGLTFTLLEDPRMAPIASLPLALVPLFGVGLSGASHLVAFHMLARSRGLASTAYLRQGLAGRLPPGLPR